MSADTGIYIVKFLDGYRVSEVSQAIENIDYYPVGSKERKEALKSYFGKSEVYSSLDLAYKQALKEEQLFLNFEDEDFIPILEYGICILDGEYENF